MIDTRDKRASAISVTLPWRVMPPAPDGTIGAEDRQQSADMYAGILASGGGGGGPATPRYWMGSPYFGGS